MAGELRAEGGKRYFLLTTPGPSPLQLTSLCRTCGDASNDHSGWAFTTSDTPYSNLLRWPNNSTPTTYWSIQGPGDHMYHSTRPYWAGQVLSHDIM